MANTKKNISDSDNTQYSELVINDTHYVTTFNKMYNQRKPYTPRNPKQITSFMPGTIQEVYVSKGAKVKEGEELLILEAMKMKNIIFAPFDGTIKSVNVKQGELVAKNHILVEMK